MDALNTEEMDVDWLILADAAQVTGNKLFILGGGWDRLIVNQLPVNRHMAVAAAFRVPWHETNQRHSFEIELQDEDGGKTAALTGQFEVGRPVGLPVGQSQRTQIALDLSARIGGLGTYVVLARLNGIEKKRITFNVIRDPAAQLQREVEERGPATEQAS